MAPETAREQPGTSTQKSRWLLVAAGLLCFAFALWLTAPGYMGSDSGDQLEQARAGRYHDAHPVLMALIWRYVDRVLPGPLGMLVLMTGLHVGGLTLLAASVRGPVLLRALGLIVVCFFPPLFFNVPAVWKDTLMQAGFISGLACFVAFLRRSASPTWRGRAADAAWLLVGLALCVIGIGSRHNAPLAAVPLLGLPLLAAPGVRRLRRWMKLVAAGAGGAALALAMQLSLGAVLAPISRQEHFWQTLPVFDLAGLSLETGELLVERSSRVLTRGMGLAEMRRLYHPFYSNSLYYCLSWRGKPCVPLFRRTDSPKALARLRSNWLHAIVSHPLEYLKLRGRMALALLGIRNAPLRGYYIGDSPNHRLAAPYPPSPQTRSLLSWVDAHLTAAWLRPWPYALLCALLAPVGIVRYARGRGSALAPALAISGLLGLLGLALAAGSPDHRYMGWTMLCGGLALVATWGCNAERRAGSTPPAAFGAQSGGVDADDRFRAPSSDENPGGPSSSSSARSIASSLTRSVICRCRSTNFV
jgi:hypothetical protein